MHIKDLSSITLFLAFFIPGSLFLYHRHKIKNSQTETKESRNGDIFSVWNYDGRIAFEDVIEAAENFDIRYCIGTGGYGSVYKAQLPSGRVLSDLRYLSFTQNYLYGSIPQELGQLKDLVSLDLSFDILTGPIPSSLGDLPNLKSLSLTLNSFNGLIPKELGQLKDLVTLDLSNNKLVDPIPPTLGLLTNLTQLHMQYNQFGVPSLLKLET
ncbi:hypothetical protein GH714_031920 [Hevea brasiliensis]|uniref:Leucine-rich repeat-containing N-terminal plant-type domain-containing protein n=1 Tax=Hevea brasiliensis TaxID=3981 RepID=A0A6A6N467_HEVBR|nr:hypothetical protein GH714_031920 [Hevea brasiliensis]